MLPLRSEIPFLLNRRRLLGCGAEIGVQRGEFSEIVLEHWRGAHLISVDPWQAAPKDEYDDITNVALDEHDS